MHGYAFSVFLRFLEGFCKWLFYSYKSCFTYKNWGLNNDFGAKIGHFSLLNRRIALFWGFLAAKTAKKHPCMIVCEWLCKPWVANAFSESFKKICQHALDLFPSAWAAAGAGRQPGKHQSCASCITHPQKCTICYNQQRSALLLDQTGCLPFC